MSNRKISEDGKVLLKIKDKIGTPEKWCKEYYHDRNRMCLKGAMFFTLDGYKLYDKMVDLVIHKHKIYIDGERCPIVEFNDAEETTHQDVMDLLDEAISKEIGYE